MHNFVYVITFNHAMQKRFQNDMAINNNLVDVLQDQNWESVPWKKLQVGDIVRVSAFLFVGPSLFVLFSISILNIWKKEKRTPYFFKIKVIIR